MASQLPASIAGTVTIGNDSVVNRVGFGAMRLPGPGVWGEPSNPTEAKMCCDEPLNSASTLLIPPHSMVQRFLIV